MCCRKNVKTMRQGAEVNIWMERGRNGRKLHRRVDNIKMELGEIGCCSMGCIGLGQDTD
jgi:hypothetical protein